jgi:hypothetical protein
MKRLALILAAAALLAGCGGDGPSESCPLVCSNGNCVQKCN